jgi:hypothetical protein
VFFGHVRKPAGGTSAFLGDPPPDPRFLASLGALSWVDVHHCCVVGFFLVTFGHVRTPAGVQGQSNDWYVGSFLYAGTVQGLRNKTGDFYSIPHSSLFHPPPGRLRARPPGLSNGMHRPL